MRLMTSTDRTSPPPSEGDFELFRDPGEEREERPRGRRRRRVIVVSGAKGGVGKTLIAANLGIYLATIGRRVTVVDADPCLANVHTFLAATRPSSTPDYLPPMPTFLRATDVNLEAFGPARPVPGRGASGMTQVPAPPRPVPEGYALDTAVPGLRAVHLGVDEVLPGHRRKLTRRRIRAKVDTLDTEFAVVDAGSAVDAPLLDLFGEAHLALFVATPEPASIENTYAFVRHLFARRLRKGLADDAERRRLTKILAELGYAPAPLDLLRILRSQGDPLVPHVEQTMQTFEFRVAFNQTRLRSDLELGDRIQSAVSRRLGLDIEYLGYVDHDDTVVACVRSQRPLLVEYPGAKASKSIEKIARRLLALDGGVESMRSVRNVPPDTHHDLLEVERGATDEEIRRAYKRARDLYAADSLACYGLFDPAGLAMLRGRIDEAYDVLLDPARRRPYELSVFPPDSLREPSSAGSLPAPNLAPAPPITPDTEFRGPLIRAVRESMGLEIRDISQRTKIGQAYVRAIEEDDYASLPALVYVKGFVSEIAKVLRLDADQVSRTYTKQFRRYIDEQER